MKQLVSLILVCALGGCAPKIRNAYEKPEIWGVQLGLPIRPGKGFANGPCSFEPSIESLPRIDLSQSGFRGLRGSVLIANYPCLGEIAQYSILADSLRLRSIVHRSPGAESTYKIRENWSLSEFTKHFKTADARLHPDLDVVVDFDDCAKFPEIQTASGRLMLDRHENGIIYFLEVFLDRGLVVATRASNAPELD